MKRPHFVPTAFALTATIALAGCGGAQVAPPGATEQFANRSPLRNALTDGSPGTSRGRSWMDPAATKSDLLYVSDEMSDDVYVFSYNYPRLKRVGTLTGFGKPVGECTDAAGDVFITDPPNAHIVEYAHGGTSPIATLNDTGYQPYDCSIDPTSGNLAVSNFETSSGSNPGNIALYKHAKGLPKAYYAVPDCDYYLGLTYDDTGDLFIGGFTAGSTFHPGVLEHGQTVPKTLRLNQPISLGSGMAWYRDRLVINEQSTETLYEFSIKGNKGTETGLTPLVSASGVSFFVIDGSHLAGADHGLDEVIFWRYPAGGPATKFKTGFEQPVGLALSKV